MTFNRRDNCVEAEIVFSRGGVETAVRATGNGSLDAASNALKDFTGEEYVLEVYTEHSMQEQGSGRPDQSFGAYATDTGEGSDESIPYGTYDEKE